MNPTDRPAPPPWALLAGSRSAPGPDLGAGFGGVVTLEGPDGGRVGALRESLRHVPEDVTTLVYLGSAEEDPSGRLVGELLGCLGDGDDAVAAAAPVTDALKRVDGDRVVGSVERRGLYSLRAPQVLRRGALAAVLDAAPEGPADPAALMVAAGRTVRIVPVAGGSGPPAADPP